MKVWIAQVNEYRSGGSVFGVYDSLALAKKEADIEMEKRTPSSKKLAGEKWEDAGTDGDSQVWQRDFSESQWFTVYDMEVNTLL